VINRLGMWKEGTVSYYKVNICFGGQSRKTSARLALLRDENRILSLSHTKQKWQPLDHEFRAYNDVVLTTVLKCADGFNDSLMSVLTVRWTMLRLQLS
jgi:hypothetical protein